MAMVKSANLALRFLLELCILAAVGYWAFHTVRGVIAKIGLGIGLPLVTAIVWGLFLAPASSLRLHGAGHLILEVVIFGLAAAALFASHHPTLAGTFLLITVVNKALMVLWGQ